MLHNGATTEPRGDGPALYFDYGVCYTKLHFIMSNRASRTHTHTRVTQVHTCLSGKA